MQARILLMCSISSCCVALGLGQNATTGGQGGAVGGGAATAAIATRAPGTFTGTFSTSTMQFNVPSLTGAPYSAEQVSERVQTLADGTHITQTMPTQRMYRDSQGRTRTERQIGMPMRANAPQPPVMIEIRDPVAGVAYILDAQGKVAHRITLQPMPGRPATLQMQSRPAARPAPPAASNTSVNPDGVETKMEPLSQQMIEGIMAEGRRITTTYPVGFQGNDRPITTTHETWMSTELGLTVLSKSDDPRSGVNTTKLINISRVEPDPILFMPPADYSIVDETGPNVTIHYTAQ